MPKFKRHVYPGDLTVHYHKEYKTWHAMIQRCTKPNTTGFHRYGGRGIRVCDRWSQGGGFAFFLEDVGSAPTRDRSSSLDRIDNDGHYEPGNVRWTTLTVQNKNRSDNHFLEFDGRRQIIRDWAKEVGLNEQTLHERLKHGWSVAEALTTPVGGKPKKPSRLVLTVDGRSQSLREWATELGLNFDTVRSRYYRGVSVEEVLAPTRPYDKSPTPAPTEPLP